MKFCGKILALFVFHANVLETTAFVVRAPKVVHTTVHAADPNPPPFFAGGGEEQGMPDPAANLGMAPEAPQATAVAPPPPPAAPAVAEPEQSVRPKIIHDESPEVIVQGGGALRTWSFPNQERVQVTMNTEGRPLDANVELWQGPDNTPYKMKVYVEDGSKRPFNAVIETPRGPNTIAIRNIGNLEFPFVAAVGDAAEADFAGVYEEPSMVLQGGALRTVGFETYVEAVQVVLKTDGRPLNARIEIIQGPNNNKQVIELYTEDGIERPFCGVFRTPGSGNVVRVLNTSPMEFPINASVEPYEITEEDTSVDDGILGGEFSNR